MFRRVVDGQAKPALQTKQTDDRFYSVTAGIADSPAVSVHSRISVWVQTGSDVTAADPLARPRIVEGGRRYVDRNRNADLSSAQCRHADGPCPSIANVQFIDLSRLFQTSGTKR